MLKSIFKFLILSVLLSLPFVNIFAQNFELNIFSKDSISYKKITAISYNKVHPNKKSIINEIDNVSNEFSKIGYIHNQYNLTEIDSVFYCEFTLHQKIDLIRIFYTQKSMNREFLNEISLNATDTYFDIQFTEVETTLNKIVKYYENLGHTFTNASLNNLVEIENILTAQLELSISQKRTIDHIVVKGYPEFPKKYLKHYLYIKPNSTFNLNSLNELYDVLNTISFVNQIKKPEVLFTKDSTTLYLYLKKKSNSAFDGIIGFSNEGNNSGIKFNGYLDLSLNNILNKGESFNIHWENSQNANTALSLNFSTPYIFNSKINFSGNFSIFKQDTLYINTKGMIDLGYNLNKNNIITLSGNSEKSEISSIQNTTTTIQNFNKKLIGASYIFNIVEKPSYINRYKFRLNTGFLFGNRKNENTKTAQQIFNLFAEYTAHLNFRNAIYIKTTTQILNTTTVFENELFRIGGINSIRGFNEQSIFTPKYNVTNLEYQYKVNDDSYLYTITDFAILNNINTNTTTQLYGVGLGYFLSTKRTILNLSYAVGTDYNTSFNINNSKVHIKITYPF